MNGHLVIKPNGTRGLVLSGSNALFNSEGINTCCCGGGDPPPPPPNRCPLHPETVSHDLIFGTVDSAAGFDVYSIITPNNLHNIGYIFSDVTLPILPITEVGQVVSFDGAVSLKFAQPLVPPPPRSDNFVRSLAFQDASIQIVDLTNSPAVSDIWGPCRLHSGSQEALGGNQLQQFHEYGREAAFSNGPTETRYPEIPLDFIGPFGRWSCYVPIECSGNFQGSFTGVEVDGELHIDIQCEGRWFFSNFGDIFESPNQEIMEILSDGRSFSFEAQISERDVSCRQPGIMVAASFAEFRRDSTNDYPTNLFTPDMVSFDYAASMTHSEGF